jgi:hypothetical protein
MNIMNDKDKGEIILYQPDNSIQLEVIEEELDEKSSVHFLHIANSDKPVKIYNSEVIISAGYRIGFYRGTFFRKWVLKDYCKI